MDALVKSQLLFPAVNEVLIVHIQAVPVPFRQILAWTLFYPLKPKESKVSIAQNCKSYTLAMQARTSTPAGTQSAGSSDFERQIMNKSFTGLQASSITKAAAKSTAEVAGNGSIAEALKGSDEGSADISAAWVMSITNLLKRA